jgi:hypothetical protein
VAQDRLARKEALGSAGLFCKRIKARFDLGAIAAALAWPCPNDYIYSILNIHRCAGECVNKILRGTKARRSPVRCRQLIIVKALD